jgi:uncharacterized membrane protein YdbT with pleckstrin-like domain
MSDPILVRISRDGKEFGTYSAQEAIRHLVYGTLRETDHYWHEGMTDWAPLTQLQASEARRQLSERKQEEERKAAELAKKRREEAEQLRQDQAKVKEEEDRAVAVAASARIEKEKAKWFRCHCCRESFKQPIGLSDMIGSGIGAILLGAFIGVLAMAGMASGGSMVPAILLFLSSIASLFGLCIVIAAFVRSPHCPMCESTNFSRPEKPDEQK